MRVLVVNRKMQNLETTNISFDTVHHDKKTIAVVVQRYSVKKVFLEISQNSQEQTCARVSFLIKLQAFLNKVKDLLKVF